MRIRLPAALIVAVSVGALSGPAMAEGDEIVLRGAWEYHEACAVCHGPDGAGDGAMGAILKVPPPDLTRLAERNGGIFPFERVFQVIDGSVPVESHGSSDMPVWGRTFRREARGEAALGLGTDPNLAAAGRIYALAQYLHAIQGGRKVPLVEPRRPRRGWPSDIPVWPDQQ